MKIIIDSGHGGKDGGGGTNEHWKEKDKVLEISLYQFERLKGLGVDVELTRDVDVFLSPNDRTKIVRESKADICISNHVNVYNGKAHGAETIHSIFSDGKLATMLLDGLVELGAYRRRVFSKESDNYKGQDYYYMHRRTGNVQTVIIEYGFADNIEDTQKILEHWKEYAESVVKTLCEYAKVTYTEPETKMNFKELYELELNNNIALTSKLARIQKIIEEG